MELILLVLRSKKMRQLFFYDSDIEGAVDNAIIHKYDALNLDFKQIERVTSDGQRWPAFIHSRGLMVSAYKLEYSGLLFAGISSLTRNLSAFARQNPGDNTIAVKADIGLDFFMGDILDDLLTKTGKTLPGSYPKAVTLTPLPGSLIGIGGSNPVVIRNNETYSIGVKIRRYDTKTNQFITTNLAIPPNGWIEQNIPSGSNWVEVTPAYDVNSNEFLPLPGYENIKPSISIASVNKRGVTGVPGQSVSLTDTFSTIPGITANRGTPTTQDFNAWLRCLSNGVLRTGCLLGSSNKGPIVAGSTTTGLGLKRDVVEHDVLIPGGKLVTTTTNSYVVISNTTTASKQVKLFGACVAGGDSATCRTGLDLGTLDIAAGTTQLYSPPIRLANLNGSFEGYVQIDAAPNDTLNGLLFNIYEQQKGQNLDGDTSYIVRSWDVGGAYYLVDPIDILSYSATNLLEFSSKWSTHARVTSLNGFSRGLGYSGKITVRNNDKFYTTPCQYKLVGFFQNGKSVDLGSYTVAAGAQIDHEGSTLNSNEPLAVEVRGSTGCSLKVRSTIRTPYLDNLVNNLDREGTYDSDPF